MKASRIILIEIAMIGCILVALYVVPESISLGAFWAASSEFLIVGNYFVVKAIEKQRSESTGNARFGWLRTLRVFAIIGIPWMLSEFALFHK